MNTENVEEMLRNARLRPTRQRVALAELLFSKGERHLSAEDLHEEARAAGADVSLATIYNTLHQFTESGLLRAISVDSTKTYFDTNTGNHHHFYIEESHEVVDMPEDCVSIANLPSPPEGMEISRIDVVVRVRKSRN
jgi:Fur family iron response transcriptional regulator